MKSLSVFLFSCLVVLTVSLMNTTSIHAQSIDTIAAGDTVKWADIETKVHTDLKASEKLNKPMSKLNYTDVSAIAVHYIPDYPIGTTGTKTKPEFWVEVTNTAGDIKNVLMMVGQPIIQKTDVDGKITSVDGKGGDDKNLPKRD